MIHRYPDGSTLEIGHGSASPPGHVGQHTSRRETWVRVNGGPWLPTDGVMGEWKVRQWAEAAETATEALEVVAMQDGRREIAKR